MAGPAPQRRPEKEERQVLQKQATEAATAFRKYMIGGEPAQSKRFWKLYNANNKKHAFMDKLFVELEKAGKDPLVKPLWEAFKKDRGRLFYFAWRNPAHFTDFIKEVESIRARLTAGTAKEKDIEKLTKLTVKYKKRKITRKESLVAKVRRAITRTTGMDQATFWKIYGDKKHRKHSEAVAALDDAVIDVLEGPARKKAAAHHGKLLTALLTQRMPKV